MKISLISMITLSRSFLVLFITSCYDNISISSGFTPVTTRLLNNELLPRTHQPSLIKNQPLQQDLKIRPSTKLSVSLESIPHILLSFEGADMYQGAIIPYQTTFFDDWPTAIAGAGIGLIYAVTRSMNRNFLENAAWENRLRSDRFEKLDNDSTGTYTELDLIREDATLAAQRSTSSDTSTEADSIQFGRRGAQKVRDRGENNEQDTDGGNPKYFMSDMEVATFERDYGVEYDPYYDEPYTEEELPDEPRYVDGRYKDVRYENGEIFYADEKNPGLFWRQGGRPRVKQFWEF